MSSQAAAPPSPKPETSQASARAKLLALAVGALLLTVAPTLARKLLGGPSMPVYGHVPDFHLVDEQGAPFTASAMLGHVTVVDFIFTRCPTSCPRLTARMGELQSRLAQRGDAARLVSISVDPENDTPAVLAGYAVRAGANPRTWSFLTGPAADVQKVVVSGFKVSAAREARGANDYDVVHGEWFVLVDAHGDIRGYFTTAEEKDLDPLMRGIAALER